MISIHALINEANVQQDYFLKNNCVKHDLTGAVTVNSAEENIFTHISWIHMCLLFKQYSFLYR